MSPIGIVEPDKSSHLKTNVDRLRHHYLAQFVDLSSIGRTSSKPQVASSCPARGTPVVQSQLNRASRPCVGKVIGQSIPTD